jgi:DNA-binding Lrp family transcriptional regulator
MAWNSATVAEALSAGRPRPPGVVTNPRDSGPRLESGDVELAAALHDDGRASYAQLAAATGWTAGRVARRLEALLASGALYVDVEVAAELLGFSSAALLWLTVAPSELTAVAERIAAARETAFVAAISGTANLHATAVCRSTPDLHDFLVREIGALPAVHTVETSPVARRVKQAGSIMQGARLPPPV